MVKIGSFVRTLVEDFDDDDGVERKVPIGTLGEIRSFDGEFYDILWANGAWTRWTEEEIAQHTERPEEAWPNVVQ